MPRNKTLSEEFTFKGHTQPVLCVAYSPDGFALASGSRDTLIRIWDAKTGQCLTTLQGHEAGVSSLIFSPDSHKIASADNNNGQLRIWDVRTGSCLLASKCESVFCFSPDGTKLLIHIREGGFEVVSAITGECIYGSPDSYYLAICSPDGSQIATASDDDNDPIIILEASTYKVITQYRGHSGHVFCFAYSPDGTKLASGAQDNKIKLWDTSTGDCRLTLYGHNHYVMSLAYSPGGSRLASGSHDDTVKLWDASTGHCIVTLRGCDCSTVSVAFSSDGALIASGGFQNFVKLWDARTCDPASTTQAKHNASGELSLLGDHSDSRSIETDTTLTRLGHISFGNPAEGLAYSAPRGLFAKGSRDGNVKICDLKTGRCIKTLEAKVSYFNALYISLDGTKIAVEDSSQTFPIWDIDGCRCLAQLADGNIRMMAFSPDGTMIATGGFAGFVKTWDIKTGKPSSTVFKGHASEVSALAYSPDGTRIASSGDADFSVKIWDSTTGECLSTMIEHEQDITCLAFSPDGGKLASGSADKTVKLWDINFCNCIATLEGHQGLVIYLNFSSDGTKIISGSYDDTVKLWETTTGTCLGGIKLGSALLVVAFHADGRSIVVGCETDIHTIPLASLGLLQSNFSNPLARTRHNWLEALHLVSVHLENNREAFKHLLDIADDFWLLVTPEVLIAAKSLGTRDTSLMNYATARLSKASGNLARQLPSCSPGEGWYDLNPLLDLTSLLPLSDYYTQIDDFLRSAPLLQLHQPQHNTFDLRGQDMAVMGSQQATQCGQVKHTDDDAPAPDHVDHCIVPFSNISGLLHALVNTGNSDVFQGIIPRSFLQYKWQTYGLRKHIWHFIMYLVGLLSLSALSLLTSGNTDIRIAATVMCVVTALPCLYGVRREIYQLRVVGLAYFTEAWNWLDLAHHAFTITCIALYIAQASSLQVIIAVAVFLRWFGILYFLQPFDATGALVRMILQIIVDIRWFLMILCIAILAGANAFLVLVRTDANCAPGYSDDDGACPSPYVHPQNSLFAMFDMLIMGSFSGSDFDFGPYTALLKVMYALARVLVSVVLLNLLIALMNNSFSAISERSDLEISMLRAKIIVEQELLMSKKQKRDPRLFPKYIHVLVRHGENVAVKQKNDALSAVLEKIASNIRDSTDKQQADTKQIKDQLKAMSDKQQAMSDKQQDEVSTMSKQLEAMSDRQQVLSKQLETMSDKQSKLLEAIERLLMKDAAN